MTAYNKCALCNYTKFSRNLTTKEIKGKQYQICKDCEPKLEKAKELLGGY